MTDPLPTDSAFGVRNDRSPSSGQMDVHGVTHVGRKRPTNEDQFLIADLKKSLSVYQTSLDHDHQTRLFGGSQGQLLLVADGMGGHEAGQRASTIAVDSIATYILNTMRWFFRLDEVSDEDFQDAKSLLKQQTLMAAAITSPSSWREYVSKLTQNRAKKKLRLPRASTHLSSKWPTPTRI